MIGIKIANPGIDVLTDTNPDNFSLYIDGLSDNVVVKFKDDQFVDVAAFATKVINHGLNYVPFCIAFKLETGPTWKRLCGHPIDGTGCWFSVDKQNITITNNTGSPVSFKYIILYDDL